LFLALSEINRLNKFPRTLQGVLYMAAPLAHFVTDAELHIYVIIFASPFQAKMEMMLNNIRSMTFEKL
jgi:hypothetical protein